ncbi:D-alanyl-D-alanine endopeptidase precursor [Streptomyces sp. ADI91-18]|uniref:serine hydrolase n=1 Tax=Streptomyces sp. ADI91-18 TaxID=1522755 RepID=UPI000F944947|nr:serine hydrolase [Streptomyces sp. ADI91-18]RPK29103.1 D-alanyl-D-alanine endopeptidase precursor [Streptomyces sp. ADI91-18]
MKAVSVAGGSPDTPETPEPEGTGIPATDPGTGDADPNLDEAKKPTPAAPAPAAAAPPEPDADAVSEAGPEAGTDTDSEPGAEPGADAEPESDAATEPGADAGPSPDPEPGADRGSAADAASEADTEPGTEPDAGAKTDADADAGPEAAADTGPEPGADSGSAADADPDPEPDADAGAGADAGLESDADTDPEPGADRGAAAGAAADADPEPGAEADSGAGADAVAEPEAERAAADAAEPGPAGAEGGPDAEPSGGAKSVSAPEPEPKAADGAGPVPKPDADAGGGEARRVPAWARGDEADAERTSTLVALKELDAPAKKATWPVAVPQRPTPPSAPAPGTGEVVEPTREVPAPAPPALDLLAELTNTPAPPETPRRTAVRRVKIWTPILLALAGAVAGGQLLRPLPEPRLVASDTAYTLEGQFSVPWPAKGQGALRVPGSGDIGTFGEQKPVPTASVAKVMTAYVILKSHPLRKGDPGAQIEIDAKAVADGASDHESRVEGLVAGTKFSQQDMLKMLMIPSANNVARLLARWDSGTGSEAAFVEKMNAAARELGMTNTTYTDPSGLDAATVSTAADQLKLADAVMKEEAFRAVVALPSAEIKGLSTPLYNNNTLLTVNGLSIRGIKTGSSTPAGGALMWAAYKSVGDETPLILGTLMDQHVDGPDPDGANSLVLVQDNSRKIIEAVRQALASAPTVRKGQQVGRVDDGLGGSTPLVATKDLNVIGVPGQRLKLTLRPGAAKVPHTAKAGTEIGLLTIGDGEGAKSVPVAVGTELAEPSFTARVSRLG